MAGWGNYWGYEGEEELFGSQTAFSLEFCSAELRSTCNAYHLPRGGSICLWNQSLEKLLTDSGIYTPGLSKKWEWEYFNEVYFERQLLLNLSVVGFRFSHRQAPQSPLACCLSLSCDSAWWLGHRSLGWAPSSPLELCAVSFIHRLRESLLPSHLMRQPSSCCLRNLKGDTIRT